MAVKNNKTKTSAKPANVKAKPAATKKPAAKTTTKPTSRVVATKPKAKPVAKAVKPSANKSKAKPTAYKTAKTAPKPTKLVANKPTSKSAATKSNAKTIAKPTKADNRLFKGKDTKTKASATTSAAAKDKHIASKQKTNKVVTTVAKSNKTSSVSARKTTNTQKGGGSSVATRRPKNVKTRLVSIVASILIVALSMGLVIFPKSCKKDATDNSSLLSNGPAQIVPTKTVLGDTPASNDSLLLSQVDQSSLPADAFINENANTTPVGFYGEYKGTVERVKPVEQTKNDGGFFASETANAAFGT